MARKKTAGGKKRTRSARGGMAKHALPRAFRIVPIRVTGRSKKHRHVLGAEGMAPCPPNCTFMYKIKIGGVEYCIYDCDGVETAVRC
jgi:hypothetical protein